MNSVVQLICRPDVDSARHLYHHWLFVELACPPLVISLSQLLRLAFGTVCHSMSSRHLLFKSSEVVLRLIYFLCLLLNYFIVMYGCVCVCHEVSQTHCGRTLRCTAFVLGSFERSIPLV